MKNRILFLCTGNYYRSRFAEIFFNYLAEASGLEWEAFSRGMRIGNPENTGPISKYALDELKKREIDPGEITRLPIQLNETDLLNSKLVIALKKEEHYPLFLKNFESWAEKIEYWNIHDIDVSIPELALMKLEREILNLVKRLDAGSSE